MTKHFTKKTENFTCENCGKEVEGTGYTNHCPFCLWSQHVDVNPGDRSAECDGLMRPVDIYLEGQYWILTHKCELCGYKKRNKLAENDDTEVVIALQAEMSKKKNKG